MSNKEIGSYFSLLAELMELHEENDFKIKSYAYAGRNLRNIDEPLAAMSVDEMEHYEGVGNAIAHKIYELVNNGKFELLDKYLAITPKGVVEMLQIKGIGPKKIRQLWKELDIENIGELEYACNENRLLELKGFGKKTQENILQQIQFIQQNANKFRWAQLELIANEVMDALQEEFTQQQISFCGNYRRKKIILEQVDFLLDITDAGVQTQLKEKYKDYPVAFHFSTPQFFYLELLKLSSAEEHFSFLSYKLNEQQHFSSENEIYTSVHLPFIPPEIRDNNFEWTYAEQNKLDQLVELNDIKGIVHTHTQYSDGANTISEMTDYCIRNKFEYLVISDHSKSAFYANGLTEDRLIKQHEEIDKLNTHHPDFKIFKSIECDILNDGSLDYSDEILNTFDLVIASVHANLKMNEEKAMQRLLKAIENPKMHILGHLTGRLLLSRSGYPVDHKKIIDACAQNGVCIEINANPYRLDIDYHWLPYCMEKNVWISINPDAHNLQGIHDIAYGIHAARKGGLLKTYLINALPAKDFIATLKQFKK